MQFQLSNPFWKITLAPDRAQIVDLRFDANGRSRWCANLLKTGSPIAQQNPIAKICGAQTGYFETAEKVHLSSACAKCQVQPNATELSVTGIEYGNVREQWHIRLDGDALRWTVEQEWLADSDVVDSFVPGLFFAAHREWGEATSFELWEQDMAHDGFYGAQSPMFGGMGLHGLTRHVSRWQNGWSIAKLLSHALPQGDLRISVTRHLKKGELTNSMSVLAQAATPRRMNKGERTSFTMTLQPVTEDTGLALDITLAGKLAEDNTTNRRFFDAHVNCGILADTVGWRFGNSPSHVVPPMVIWMPSEMLKFGVPRGSLGQNCYHAQQVLARYVRQMAECCLQNGTIGPGYFNDSALDQLPAFLMAARDSLLISGDRAEADALWPGMQRAVRDLAGMLERGNGLIFTPKKNSNDYWDWIERDGWIGFVNIIAHAGLRAFEETARWLGREPGTLSDSVSQKFNERFWDEKRGCYADWIDKDGQPAFFLYVAQLLGIANGLVPPDRARQIVDAIRQRRRELGSAWENCFALQTNFYDAEEFSLMKRQYKSDVTRFGRTMNGGCLVSWTYYWIGALVAAGYVDEAIDAWQRVVRRFRETSLNEGCNLWDFAGQPSRTTFPDDELIAYEPYLSDQGLVSLALPRWLLGVEPRFDGIGVQPVLPASAYPVTMKLQHLGQERTIHITGKEK